MYDIRPALRGHLLADPAISAKVEGERIYPVRIPQGVNGTSIVYNRISGQGDHHNQGPSGLARSRVQIDCWAKTADAASTLANLVKDRLDGWQGDMEYGSSSPREFVNVPGAFFENERDLWDPESEMYGVSRDYFIWVREL